MIQSTYRIGIARVAMLLSCMIIAPVHAELSTEKLPKLPQRTTPPPTDWLIDRAPYAAGVFRTDHRDEIVLDNGLIRRTFRLAPNGATVGLDNLVTGQSLLRGVKPEAVVSIDGQSYNVGGLTGQPDYAYLSSQWLDAMTADLSAMRLVRYEVGPIRERFQWKQVRRHAPDAAWPPHGVELRFDYAMPAQIATEQLRPLIWADDFNTIDTAWRVSASKANDRISFNNEGKPGEIYALPGSHCYAEHAMPPGAGLVDVTLDPGTDRGVSWGPGVALVYNGRVIKLSIRPADRGEHAQFELRVNGHESLKSIPAFSASDRGLDLTTAYHLRARFEPGKLIWEAARADGSNPNYFELFTVRVAEGDYPKAIRVGKMDRQGGGTDDNVPGEPGRCHIQRVAVHGPVDTTRYAAMLSKQADDTAVIVSVHYALYDGLPALSKWITVENHSDSKITVDHFVSERLAIVEEANWVETRDGVAMPRPRSIHIETDFAFGGFNAPNANRHIVHWRPDPQYTTQVNYTRQTPCLLDVEPTYGPSQDIAPGGQFESCRAFELIYDSMDRDRRGLALKRLYRTVAPWVTENPLMHHLLTSSPEATRRAIDQAAEVGFEMIIMSFGSGFNMDNEDPAYLATWNQVADYAHAKGIEIGSYSLLSSRAAPAGNMIVCPPGQRPAHGQCPALASDWGQAYFKRLRSFYEKTGFDLLENDGSYPGDVDITPRPPLQKGVDDSRWVQWRIITDYYQWCRARGIYLNVPDFYYLSGANKCGMGYRETNWSLPRAMQVIHTRQNIYDGTWTKTPSMGWMFVPLSQYHGGGAAATIEPLHEHIDHYRRMIMSNLALGVQACYRGPRLYDSDEVRDMVKGCVNWFKQYRDILESDVVHGRRADGRDIDWMLHVNPSLKNKGMLVVFNPLTEPVDRTLHVNLYYTGLTDTAQISDGGAPARAYKLARDFSIDLPMRIEPESMNWYVIQ